MQSINEIKEILKNTDVTALSEFIKHYNTDERSGVKKLVLKAEKEIEAYNKEVARTENLKFFENKYSCIHSFLFPDLQSVRVSWHSR